MFRQPPRAGDISHCSVQPRLGMTAISKKVNWLCWSLILCCSDKWSEAVDEWSGSALSFSVSSAWQGHTCLKVAAATCYARPVISFHFLQMLLSAPQDPCCSYYSPTSITLRRSIKGAGNMFSVRTAEKQGWWSSGSRFLDTFRL